MFVHTVIMVIEPHMKQGRQHKLISTIFLATSVTKKLDHNTSTQIKENSQKEKKENTLSWLEQSVISVLKDYAEEIGGTFNSEDDEVGNRIITLRNDGGFDIDSENVRLRMALSVASYTYIGYGDGKSVLNLTYDPIVIGK